MNKAVQLLNEWAAYEETHSDASLEEFCRYFLTAHRAKQETPPNFAGGGVPTTPRSFLMKVLGFLCRASQVYYDKAFENIPEVRQKEDFYFLNNISNKKECRKTEVVHEQMLGLTTGIDTLNRLLSAELITERPDPSDGRAKLVSLTFLGHQVLKRCYQAAQRVNEIILNEMPEEDVLLCIQLLRGIEARQSLMVYEMKDKSLEEIYHAVVGASGEPG